MRQANSSQAQSRVLHNFRFPTLRRLVMIMIIDIIKKRHAIALPITGSQNQPVADHQDPVEQEQCFNFRLLPGGQSSQNQPIKILQINSAYQVLDSVRKEQCLNLHLLPGGQSSQNQPIKILQINSAYQVLDSVRKEQCLNLHLLPGGQSSQNQPIKILQIPSA